MKFDHVNFTGYWTIDGVDILNQKLVGIDAEKGVGTATNLVIKNLRIAGQTGATVYTGTGAIYPNKGYNIVCSVGLFTWLVNNITVQSVTFDHQDMPFEIDGCNGLLIDTFTITTTKWQGGLVSILAAGYTREVGASGYFGSSNVEISNFTINDIGTTGMYWGTAGLQLNGVVNTGGAAGVHDGEIKFVHKIGTVPDGVGFDFEGQNQNITLNNVNIHDCEGAAILLFDTHFSGDSNEQTGTSITNCTATNNGTSNHTSIPAFMRIVGNMVSPYTTVTGCTVTRVSGQTENTVSDTSGDPQGNVNTFPTRFTVSGNTLI